MEAWLFILPDIGLHTHSSQFVMSSSDTSPAHGKCQLNSAIVRSLLMVEIHGSWFEVWV